MVNSVESVFKIRTGEIASIACKKETIGTNCCFAEALGPECGKSIVIECIPCNRNVAANKATKIECVDIMRNNF